MRDWLIDLLGLAAIVAFLYFVLWLGSVVDPY